MVQMTLKKASDLKLTASGFTMVYNNGKNLVVTLKDSKSNIIKNAKISIKLVVKLILKQPMAKDKLNYILI